MPNNRSPLIIKRVHIENIKSFDDIEITFGFTNASAPWTVIVGDNTVGKTAVLRCIAMGLCDESSAAGLMKESEEGYIRRSSPGPGIITIDLLDRNDSNLEYQIKTIIERVPTNGSEASFERLRQETTPAKRFPWDRIFACAYGMGRGTGGTGDIAGYTVINAVYNLFSYGEGLQNPELTIKRLAINQQQPWLEQIGKVFEEPPSAMRLRDRGISIGGKWGDDMPLRDLADGIRATFLWVADFVGWALAFSKSTKKTQDITGIILIDELEQHLHATWQRRIVSRLRDMFPNVQFIVTTHSPLIVGSVGALPFEINDPEIQRSAHDELLCLERSEEGTVNAIRMESMRLQRVDQILASRAFKYLIDEDPAVERVLKIASILAGKPERTPDEESTYKQLSDGLRDLLFVEGQTLVERRLELKQDDDLRNEIRELENEVFGEHK